MAVDFFLKIDGIKGESMDSTHKDEIDLQSWSWGETQTGSHAFGGGGGSGKVSMQDFHFVMNANLASPKLLLACASGEQQLRRGKVGIHDEVEVLHADLPGAAASSKRVRARLRLAPRPGLEVDFVFVRGVHALAFDPVDL